MSLNLYNLRPTLPFNLKILPTKEVIFAILLNIILAVNLNSQTNKIKFERISIEQGLSQSTVSCILQDSKGFMWFSANYGLNKFDGHRFTVYTHDPGNPFSLSHNDIWTIREDTFGAIWIGTYGGGLNRFDRETETFAHWKHNPDDSLSLSNNFIISLYVDPTDSNSTVWIGTEGGGLNRFNPREWKKNSVFTYWKYDPNNPRSLSENSIMRIYKDKSGVLWISTNGGGLNRFNRDTETFDSWVNDPGNNNSLSNNYIERICESKNSGTMDTSRILWLGMHGGGLNMFDIATETFIRYNHQPGNPNSLNTNYIYSMYIDESDAIWIGTDGGGLNRFDLKTETFTHWIHDNKDASSLPDNEIISLYEDRSGILWIGTLNGGLSKLNLNHYKKGRFVHWVNNPENPNSLSHNDVRSIFEDSSGNLWIGTYGGGLNRLDREKEIFEHWIDKLGSYGLSQNNFISMCEDQYGALWIGTYGAKLIQFDRNKKIFKHWPYDLNMPDDLYGKFVFSLYPDQSGLLWIGTERGLNSFNRDKESFDKLKNDPGSEIDISSNRVTSIFEDRSGTLWIGKSRDGLNKYNRETETLTTWINEPGNLYSLSNNYVQVIYEDKSGVMWIGTKGGLNKFDRETGKFFHYRIREGLPNDEICAILEDDSGNLWLSTKKGLSKFNPGLGNFKNYDVRDGLQSNEFNRGAAHKSSNGEMFFGGINGLTSFFPDSIKNSKYIPPIVITDFKILNQSVNISPKGETPLKKHISVTDEIELSYKDYVFSIEFAALDYTSPERNQYGYKMEGFDKEWIYSGNRQFVTYTNLDPGEYVFRVKGTSSDGLWNEKGRSLKITVTPPWWKTSWAYVLFIIGAITLIYTGFRFELNRERLKNQLKLEKVEAEKLQELDRMKSRFFANISHEFRTPLSLILGPIQEILNGSIKENLTDKYRLIIRNARRLLQLINQLLDLSKLESGKLILRTRPANLVPMIKGIFNSLESLAQSKNVTMQFRSDKEEVIIYFDFDKMEKIFSNLLSNAFKFTPPNGKIIVEISNPKNACPETVGRCVEIRIKDSGEGIPPEHLPYIFDRFYQVNDSYIRNQQGSGIGLALAKDLVNLHHGTIKVTSEEGKGTEFIISLPLGKDHLKAEDIIEKGVIDYSLSDVGELEVSLDQGTKPLADNDRADDINSMIVLIVEDNDDMRKYLKDILGDTYEVEEAVDGKNGFDVAVDSIPDIIISDVMMPKMDGYQLCEKLKNDERTSHIPVILLTAKSSGESKVEGLQFGADDYLIKPFDSAELKVRIKNLIEQRRQLRERFSHEVKLQPGDIAIAPADETFLKRAIDIVEQHLDDPDLNVDWFSKEIGLSRSQLHRKLNAIIDQSTSEFIRSLRLKRAVQLLEKNAATVSEIAYMVGFNSPTYFHKCFRDQFGVSPSEYFPDQL